MNTLEEKERKGEREVRREAGERESNYCMLLRAPWIHRNHLGVMLLRIGVGTMVLMHGIPKLVMLVQGEGSSWMDPLGIGSTLSLALCVFAEFFCGMAVLLGIFTRLAALVLVFNFWVIVFVYDAARTPMQEELPLLYLVCFAALVCTGGGRWSLDALIWRRYRCHSEEAPGGLQRP